MAIAMHTDRAGWTSALRICLSVLILVSSGVANAQYFLSVSVPPPAPPDCNADSVFFGTNATVNYNLPSAPNNQILFGTVNGVVLSGTPQFDTISPPSGTDIGPITIAPLGTPTVPYTVVFNAFPALNGVPVGTGARVTIQCNTLGAGVGVATFSSVAAPSTAGIPATSTQGLIALAVLLAGAAMWQFRRKRV